MDGLGIRMLAGLSARILFLLASLPSQVCFLCLWPFYKSLLIPIIACAKYLCQQCYSMGGAGFKECCNQPTPYVCFDQAEGGGNQDITTAPPSVTNAQQRACQTAGDMMLSCESATSGFDSLDDSDAASCLCYSNTHWQPKSFDQPFSSCIAWASTADTSDYVNWNSMRGFCSSVGDVMKNGPASASATTTAATDGATASAKNSAGMVKPSMAILMVTILQASLFKYVTFANISLRVFQQLLPWLL